MGMEVARCISTFITITITGVQDSKDVTKHLMDGALCVQRRYQQRRPMQSRERIVLSAGAHGLVHMGLRAWA